MMNETIQQSMLTAQDCAAATSSMIQDLTIMAIVLAVLAFLMMIASIVYYTDYSLRRKYILTKKQEQDFQEWLDDRKKFMGD